MKASKLLLLAALGAAAAGCSHTEGWSVEGTVAAGSGKLALEGYNNGLWYAVDSLKPSADGHFAYRSTEPASYPEIMRLSGGGLAAPVFFPVDGRDAITIRDGKAYGSKMADGMRAVDSLVNEATVRSGTAAAADTELRRSLGQAAIDDSTSIIAYYVLNKSIGGRTLFDPAESFGSRIYGAVAQNFATNRPDDPRGAMIRAVYLEGRKALGKGIAPADSTIQLGSTGIIDIVRYDDRGTRHSLAEEAAKGNVVLLSFTNYQGEYSPAYTVILNELYDKYHERGLEIYQLAFDPDEVAWKESARNLPWITVYNAPTDGLSPLASYNVGSLPTTYIIDRHGDLRQRVDNPLQLDQQIKPHL